MVFWIYIYKLWVYDNSYFVLTIYLDDYIQTMTISRPKNSDKIKVSVELQEIGNMSMHMSNLLRGRVFVGKYIFKLCKSDNT